MFKVPVYFLPLSFHPSPILLYHTLQEKGLEIATYMQGNLG